MGAGWVANVIAPRNRAPGSMVNRIHTGPSPRWEAIRQAQYRRIGGNSQAARPVVWVKKSATAAPGFPRAL